MPVYQVIFTVLPIHMGVIPIVNIMLPKASGTPHTHGGDSDAAGDDFVEALYSPYTWG